MYVCCPQECGYFEVGAVYLVIFITIGAFVFANLVVAVVVTNLVSGSSLLLW